MYDIKSFLILAKHRSFLLFLACLIMVINLSLGQSYALSATSNTCVTAVGTVAPGQPTPGCTPSSTNTTPGPGSNNEGGGLGNFTYYCQGNPIWSNNCSLGDAGCGPTSLAMVMSTFGIKMTPPEVDSVFQRNGWRDGCPNGSDIHSAIHSQWFLQQGFTVPEVDLIDGNSKPLLTQMKNYLDQGYLIIVNGHDYPCKGCIDQFAPVGHYFVVDEVDIPGQRMHTRDPNNCSYATGVENQGLAWTDMKAPRSVGGGADSWYNVYPIKK